MSPVLLEHPLDVQSRFSADSDPCPVPVTTTQLARDIQRLTPDEEQALQVSFMRCTDKVTLLSSTTYTFLVIAVAGTLGITASHERI